MKWSLLTVRAVISAGLAALLVLIPSCASKDSSSGVPVIPDIGWPRTFLSQGTTFSVYQPQLKSWDMVNLTARAVFSALPPGASEPQYGTMSISATTVTDKVLRLVSLNNLTVTAVDFPTSPSQTSIYQSQLGSWLSTAANTIALDRLEADLAILNAQKSAVSLPVQNNPPQFIVSYSPAMLVLVQGTPVFQPVAGTSVQRLVNTRALILKGPEGKFYLHLWDGYLQAPSLSGPWAVSMSVPDGTKTAETQAVQAKSVDLLVGQKNPETGQLPSLSSTPIPTVYVATQPTSLIVFAGQPVWSLISGTQLSYATNTTANVFQYSPTQAYYVLTSGRWFTTSTLSGPWSYVPNSGLPTDFAQIPSTSPKENVLASVAGTTQAQEAVIANSIPQMTRVEIATVAMSPVPTYDGGVPVLVPIDGTPLARVSNTLTPVIKVSETSWYSVQNGIWFTAASASGPWQVATVVPGVIYTIPLSSSLHWVTYVKVYKADTEYVWAGFTPGYYGTVVTSDGVVVYGTGYVYDPYVGAVFVPAPVTYGYDANLAWTPWTGWGYGFAAGWAWGASWSYWCAPPPVPYWGGYTGWAYNSYGGVTAWGPGGWAATTGNVYHNWGNWSGVTHAEAGFNAWTGREGVEQWGHAYNSVTGTMAVGTRGAVANVYNGNYAAGSRGAAYNPNTGMAAMGGHGTVGNAYTGWSANYAHGTVMNPATGQATHYGGIQGADGNGVYHVGNNTFASADGNIYRNSDGSWQQYDKGGGWNSVNDSAMHQSLDDTWARQSAGSYRSDSWDSTRSSFGGWGGGSRWGGGGGFGGFGGGGFRGGGFRR